MATDRDEQARQQQELEEIRRSFAEMGARMGSLFDPAESDEPEPVHQPAPAPVPAPVPATFQPRPRWWWAVTLGLLFVAGTLVGWILPRGGEGSDDPPSAQATTATTAPASTTQPPAIVRTVVSVPEECLDAAELADEIISKLNRNDRDNRLALAIRDYTIANQACRREASP
jgi:hypothetical protein